MDYMTTTENIVELQQSMVLAEMPVTFRDAIVVTRRLGIQYLWIDAIRIVQDDAADWERESGRMASTYGSSTLTLSATTSRSVHAGLSPRRPQTNMIEYVDEMGQQHSVYVRKSICHEFRSEDFYKDHSTLKRGWCFQERLLSSRVLHFNVGEMVWNCKSGVRCECGNDHKNRSTREQYDDLVKSVLVQDHEQLFTSVKHGDFTILQRWGDLVDEYMGTALTYDSDRLPALSGIAQRLRNAGLCEYNGGLWSLGLEQQLMWSRSRSGIAENFGRLTTQYTAPSFSPFSRVGRLSFSMKRTDVVVLESSSTLKGSDPTGAITSGHIILRGPTLKVSAGNSRRDHRFGGGLVTECYDPSGNALTLLWMPDGDEIVECLPSYTCFFILKFHSYFCLILCQDDRDANVFYRIGSARSQIFEESTEKVVDMTMKII
jgi:hypothetical protein